MQHILDLLKNDEGTGPVVNGRMMPYEDSEGLMTIGYGRCIEKVGISFEEADHLLNQSVKELIYDCGNEFVWFDEFTLEPARYAAVVSMVYNLGLAGFKEFEKTIAFIDAREFDHAATEMLDSKWAKQVGHRAIRLSEMMRTGAWA